MFCFKHKKRRYARTAFLFASTLRTVLIPGHETFVRKIGDAKLNGVFDQLLCR